MTDQTHAYPGYESPQFDPGGDVADQSAKDKAADSAQAGKQAAGEVAQKAAGHAQEVAQEAQSQARDLLGEARGQLRGQAGEQHRNAVTNLRSLGDELRSMSANTEQRGTASELVGQAADRAHGVADWLEGRQPEDVLDELRRVARRKPGAFLLGALAAGVVAGRLTRGAVATHSDDSTDQTSAAANPAPSLPDGYGTDTGRHQLPGDTWAAGTGGVS